MGCWKVAEGVSSCRERPGHLWMQLSSSQRLPHQLPSACRTDADNSRLNSQTTCRLEKNTFYLGLRDGVNFNIAADIALETLTSADGGDALPSWSVIASLCAGKHLLEAQFAAATALLARDSTTPLTPLQERLLCVRPSSTTYLKGYCACGCSKTGAHICTGCRRAHYGSPECQAKCVN